MNETPSIVCRVVSPIRYPLAAEPDQYLLVSPSNLVHTLCVADADGRVLRTAPEPAGGWYAEIRRLIFAGAVRAFTEADGRALMRVA
jgi:hypothetical protein